jgi:hypothetical protein
VVSAILSSGNLISVKWLRHQYVEFESICKIRIKISAWETTLLINGIITSKTFSNPWSEGA